MKKISLGLVGCGNIGTELAEFIQREYSDKIAFRYVCEHHPEKITHLKKKLQPLRLKVLPIFELVEKSDFIIEAACPEVARGIIQQGIRKKKKMLIMSAGGLLGVSEKLLRQSRGYELYCPSGAIAGVDALLAAKEGDLKKVTIRTKKPYAGLEGADLFEKKVKKLKAGKNDDICIFKGTAKQAIKAFPKNINVSAVLSVAGIGATATKVEIWASAHSKNNVHEVTVEGSFGKIKTTVENVPSPDNPKTSYLAVLSAKALIRKIFSPVMIGT